MRMVRVTAAVAASVALLAGCSRGEQANETLPSSSTSTSAEPSETTPALPPIGPADFPMPVEARKKTEAGAEAFLDYYIAVEARSDEGEPIRQISSECAVCRYVADQKDADLAKGYQSSGGDGPTTVIESIVQGDQANVIFSTSASEVSVVDANGLPVPDRGDPAVTSLELDAFMVWDVGRTTWLMTEFAQR